MIRSTTRWMNRMRMVAPLSNVWNQNAMGSQRFGFCTAPGKAREDRVVEGIAAEAVLDEKLEPFKDDILSNEKEFYREVENDRCIQKGDIVKAYYTAWYIDPSEDPMEQVFDRVSREDSDEDIGTLLIGDPDLIPGLSNRLIGLKAGDERTFEVPCVEGFGEYDIAKLVAIRKSGFPDDITKGMVVQTESGQSATVMEINEEEVVLDGNHGLAGFDLKFRVEIVQVLEPAPVAAE